MEMAKTVNELMLKLGYTKYVAQGGDWGAVIVKTLGTQYAESCRAVHTNMPVALPDMWNPRHVAIVLNAMVPGASNFPIFLTQKELDAFARQKHFQLKETGYQKIQGTKPQTLGYGLTDSPVGLLAWIVEKFRTWSDCNGNVESVFSKDELLTNVSIYWFSRNITSSCRIYYEAMQFLTASPHNPLAAYCKAPTGVAVFPKEMIQPVWTLIRSSYNLKHSSEFDRGGHFAALEVPELLAKDIQDFFGQWH
eukprot:jgi/Botrbrau1/21954/Bobra.0249s0077.1